MPRLARGLLTFLSPFVFFAHARPSAAQEQAPDRMRLILAHDNTSFPLTGKHRFVDCGSCHLDGVLGGTPETCEACHWDRRQDDPNRLQLGTACADCHTTASWARILPGAFEHEERTGFALAGSHASLSCTDCHSNRSFASATAECVQCHMDDFRAARMPDHQAANFSTNCGLCHRNEIRWEGARFDHDSFPLTGPHRAVSCESCHAGGRFEGTARDCFSCHRGDFESAREPDHQQSGFSTDCLQCHKENASSWQGAEFDHDQIFPLRGMHQSLECSSCHRDGTFAGTPGNCYDCHRADYEHASSPNHLQAGFPTDCASCHGASASSWQGAGFDHDRVFPLRGLHRAAECTQCHVDGRYQGTPSTCFGCHQADYERTASPNHASAGFGTDCESCHGDGASSWSSASVEHDRFFPLRGQHRAADCASCHVDGRFAGTPSTCFACHQDDYQRTTTPNHASAGFGTDCESCHGDGASSWRSAGVDHDRFFPLRGQHRAADCASCHADGRFAGTPSTCFACHQADYQRTTTPNHASAGFGTDCASCHGDGATTWGSASFDHDRVFPLRGQHQAADCASCHVNGRYAGTSSSCIDCHRADYDGALNPNHRQAGFSTDCTTCHGNQASSWLGASFDHNQFFPLQGAHRALDCQACHARGYNLPRDCFGCHAPDYNGARNPDHVQSGFPTSCENCHLPGHTSWSQAVFQHDFPIGSGPHARFDCVECHQSSTKEFSCTQCHEHEKTRMDEKHKEVGGYVYNSQACYSCHPNGRS